MSKLLANKEVVNAPLFSSTSVCMHVLGAVRNDQRVMREATALVQEGCTVFIVDVEGDCNQPVEEDIRGVHVKHIIMSSAFAATRFTKWPLLRAAQLLIRSTLRLLQTSADFYHAHDETALLQCCIASLIRRKPLIFDAHELPLDEMGIRWRWLHVLFTCLLAIMLPRCAGVITVSEPIAQEIRKRYHCSQVAVIRNILPYKSIPKSDRLRQSLGLSTDVCIALYQGSLHANRGLDRLIRAAPFLAPGTVIVMMGKGDAAELSELEALVARVGCADRVRIIPAVPYAELLDWTASADIGLIVNPPEISLNVQMCLPNKFFEYLMAGLPVLSSSLDVVGEVIRTHDIGYVISSLAPGDIGEAINTMLANPIALARMRHNALEVAQNEFCWEKERTRLLHLYQGIVAKQMPLAKRS